MANKRGGDLTQINYANQGNAATQSLSGSAVAGPTILGSIGSAAILAQIVGHIAAQDLGQGNASLAGYAGADNGEADTTISAA